MLLCIHCRTFKKSTKRLLQEQGDINKQHKSQAVSRFYRAPALILRRSTPAGVERTFPSPPPTRATRRIPIRRRATLATWPEGRIESIGGPGFIFGGWFQREAKRERLAGTLVCLRRFLGWVLKGTEGQSRFVGAPL